MKVTRWIPGKPGSNLLAYFNLYIEKWGLTICSCSLIRNENGGTFIAMPSRSYEKDGQTKWSPYVWWDKEVSTRFMDAAKGAVDRYITENAQKRQEQEAPAAEEDKPLPF